MLKSLIPLPAWWRKLWKVTVWLCGFLLVSLLTALLTAPLWQRRWIEPRPFADLSPSAPILQPSEVRTDDAFDLILQAWRLTGTSEQAFSPKFKDELKKFTQEPVTVSGTVEKFPLLTAALKQHAAALDLLRRAAVAPNPRVPTPARMEEKIGYTDTVLTLGKLLCFSASSKAADGDWPGAFAELNTVLKLGEILTNGGPLIHRLISVTISERTLDTLNQLIADGDVPAELLTAEAERLSAHEQNMPAVSETFRYEFFASNGSLQKVLQPLAPDKLSWFKTPAYWGVRSFVAQICGSNTRNEITAALNALEQKILEHLARPYDHATAATFEDTLLPPRRGLLTLLGTRTVMSMIMAGVMLPGIDSVRVRVMENQFKLRATRLNLIVSASAKTNGLAPANLAALTVTAPADPFLESQPLTYRADSDTSWRIISVGCDQIDDAGNPIPTPKPSTTKAINQKGDLVLTGTLHR